MRSVYLPFSPPRITEDAVQAVSSVLRSGWLGTGPLAKDFEDRFSQLCEVSSSAAVSSCTSGLFLAMKALGLGPGDEVITSSMTFVSTVNSIIHLGAKPVLVDIDAQSGNLDLAAVESAITKKTRAIIPVHYAGFPVQMDLLMEIARKADLYVVEDCAHAVETLWAGRRAGTWGNAGVFSFYATKNIAVGEGGIVVSGDPELIEKIATLSLHGLSKGAWTRFSETGKRTYDVVDVGYKSNFTDLQAAIGLSQLAELGENFARRKEIWDYYDRELIDFPLELPHLPSEIDAVHARHLYVVRLPETKSRDELVEVLGDKHKVAFGVHYKAITQFPLYREILDFDEEAFPVASDWGSRCLSLSISPGMADSHVERVVEALKSEIR